jgi:hypothetical protein
VKEREAEWELERQLDAGELQKLKDEDITPVTAGRWTTQGMDCIVITMAGYLQ